MQPALLDSASLATANAVRASVVVGVGVSTVALPVSGVVVGLLLGLITVGCGPPI